MSTTTPTPSILSAPWWEAAGWRALRTAIVIAIPYLGGASLLGIPWLAAASAAGMGIIASLLTSLAGLPEVTGKTTPVWLALLERVAKTAGQSLAAGIGTAALFSQVHWSVVVQTAAVAALGSLFIGVLGYLPEASTTTGPTTGFVNSGVDAATIANALTASTAPAVVPVAPQDADQPAAGVPPAN